MKERVRLLKGMGRENAGLAARIAAWIRRMIDRFVAHFRRAGDRLSERQTADEKLKADAKAWKQTLKEAWEAGGAKKAWCVL